MLSSSDDIIRCPEPQTTNYWHRSVEAHCRCSSSSSSSGSSSSSNGSGEIWESPSFFTATTLIVFVLIIGFVVCCRRFSFNSIGIFIMISPTEFSLSWYSIINIFTYMWNSSILRFAILVVLYIYIIYAHTNAQIREYLMTFCCVAQVWSFSQMFLLLNAICAHTHIHTNTLKRIFG